MNENEFKQLLSQKENNDLDYKQELPDAKKIAQLVTAYYNSRGGKIVLGVEDGTRKPIGLDNAEKTEHNFVQVIRHWCKLDREPDIEFVKYDGKDFVVVHCPKGENTPYFVRGEHVPRVRIGSSNMPAHREEIARLYREGSHKSQDVYPVENATLDDIDILKVKEYFMESDRTGNMKGRHMYELMQKEGLIVPDENGYVPTYAGILLFGKHPQLNIHCAFVKADRYRGVDMIEWIDKNDYEGNIFELIEKCEYFFKKNMRVAAWSSGFKTEHKSEYPIDALKEAVINALAHRDYHQYGKDILIRMFDDRIEISSPGGLLRPLTIESIQQHDYKPNSRNKIITKALLRKGVMDERGSGILRMEDAMSEWGLEKPNYAEKDDYFVIEFKGPARTEKPLDDAFQMDLNDRQKRALEYIRDNGKITRREYVGMSEVSVRMANVDIKNLEDKGLIKKAGSGRSVHYVFK